MTQYWLVEESDTVIIQAIVRGEHGVVSFRDKSDWDRIQRIEHSDRIATKTSRMTNSGITVIHLGIIIHLPNEIIESENNFPTIAMAWSATHLNRELPDMHELSDTFCGPYKYFPAIGKPEKHQWVEKVFCL